MCLDYCLQLYLHPFFTTFTVSPTTHSLLSLALFVSNDTMWPYAEVQGALWLLLLLLLEVSAFVCFSIVNMLWPFS